MTQRDVIVNKIMDKICLMCAALANVQFASKRDTNEMVYTCTFLVLSITGGALYEDSNVRRIKPNSQSFRF